MLFRTGCKCRLIVPVFRSFRKKLRLPLKACYNADNFRHPIAKGRHNLRSVWRFDRYLFHINLRLR
jgi:hypothetical protein